MGERTPHLDPDCRGAFIGLSAMHTKYDMLRAVMEGVTYSQRDSVEVLKTMGVSIDGMLACGGGGSSKLWRQMLADTYNCAVRTVVSRKARRWALPSRPVWAQGCTHPYRRAAAALFAQRPAGAD